jgi:hypothetical protein
MQKKLIMETSINSFELDETGVLWQKTIKFYNQNDFIDQFGSWEFPDPEMLPPQYDPQQDGN